VTSIYEYFERPDTPASGSPVGVLIVRIVEKYPSMEFKEARAQAKALLQQAAGRRIYRFPRVLSPEEQAREKDRLKTAFGTLPKAA
jgi:hypothetical protein